MKIGIAGLGKVGKALQKLIPEALVYDPPQGLTDEDALDVDLLFICVPTPPRKKIFVGECDSSIVEDVLEKSKAKINIVRSTVWVGFTQWAMFKFPGKDIIFMPEYGPSDFPNHPFQDISKINWAVLGGERSLTNKVAKFWEEKLYNVKIFHTDSKTAELVKLVENAYFYNKLMFLNHIYDLCGQLNIEYDDVRTMLTEDPRIEADHSFIYPDRRQVGGPCLPKDMSNLIALSKKNQVTPTLLELLVELNELRT